MAYYIFQGNPKSFDIEGYLNHAVSQKLPIIRWLVTRYANDIVVGDVIFLWRSAGDKASDSGVVGMARVASTPVETEDDPESLQFWLSDADLGKRTRVDLELLAANTGAKQLVRRDWMKEDPILSELGILKMPSGTNFPVTESQASRLKALVENTGVPWSKAESTAGLWLYNRLIDRPISRSKDSEVAEVAVRIGRAVTGVYNKVMNFRSIDPRDERAGMKGAGAIDHKTWAAYYEQAARSLNVDALDFDYERIWGTRNIQLNETDQLDSKQPSEASNDDVGDKRLTEITRRRGQPAFRKRLLHLYDHRCAITGVNVDLVLDAAHIVGHAESGVNHSDNGILLRSDLHDLFDAGLLVVDADTLRVKIDESLKDAEYRQLDGKFLNDGRKTTCWV